MIFVKNPISVLAFIFLGNNVVIELKAVSMICLLLLIAPSYQCDFFDSRLPESYRPQSNMCRMI